MEDYLTTGAARYTGAEGLLSVGSCCIGIDSQTFSFQATQATGKCLFASPESAACKLQAPKKDPSLVASLPDVDNKV